MSHRFGRHAALLSTAAFLAAAGPAAAQDQQASENSLSLALDWFVNPNHAPIIIAEENGYFDEEGLSVEIIAPADPSDPPKMAAAGRVGLAISYQPQLHLQIHEGMPLKRVGTLIDQPLNCLMVLQDSPIETMADLDGRSIGYSVAGVEEAILGRMLAEADLTLDDIDLVSVNFSLSPALMSGQVDAVIGAYRNFELNQMEIEGEPGRCLAVEEHGVPAYEELIYVANPDSMDEEAIASFLHATERGVEFIRANPEEAWTIFSETSPELNDQLNEMAFADTIPYFTDHPAALDEAIYQSFEQFLVDSGMLDSALPVGDLAIELTAQPAADGSGDASASGESGASN